MWRPLDQCASIQTRSSYVNRAVHGHAKQGASFGYTRVLGLNMLLATASTRSAAVVVVEQRLRKGSCGSPRAAKRLIADALNPSGRYDPTGPLARCGRTPPSTEAGLPPTRTRRKRGSTRGSIDILPTER